MTTARARDPRCRCDAPAGARGLEHRTSCPVFQGHDGLVRRMTIRAIERMEEIAAGRRTIRGAAWALTRYFRRQESLSSARGLPIDHREGSGRPNRALDDPGRIFDRQVAYAIKLAEQDDRERHPGRPERELYRWLAEHFGGGRACAWIAEAAGLGEALVSERIERARRVVQRRLRKIGAMEDGSAEE